MKTFKVYATDDNGVKALIADFYSLTFAENYVNERNENSLFKWEIIESVK